MHQAKFALGGLIVDEARMTHNLGISRGLIVAEAVMMGMAPHIGRQQAHDVVYDACRTRQREGRHARRRPCRPIRASRSHFDRATIETADVTDQLYLGLAPRSGGPRAGFEAPRELTC